MLKLQQLKNQKKQAAEAAKVENEGKEEEDSKGEGEGGTGYILKRQNSKELAEKRKQKSKENVFTLRRSGAKKDTKKKKQNAAELRVHKDISEMDTIPGAKPHFPDPNNLMAFELYITPTDGLYKGAEFKFTITIPNTYPYDPPKALCETPIYHPNIDYEGHVCLNILRSDWMPVLNLGAVVFGLVTLFLQPNPDDPLNKEVAQLMIDNKSQFERNVKQTLQGGNVGGRQYPRLLK